MGSRCIAQGTAMPHRGHCSVGRGKSRARWCCPLSGIELEEQTGVETMTEHPFAALSLRFGCSSSSEEQLMSGPE